MDAILAADILSDGSGYGSVLVDFKNGASLGGNLIAESPDHLDLDATGKLVRVSHSDIASFTQPISSMPPMGTLLIAAELRDIVAWLASLTEGGVPVKSTAVPVPLDPATLEIPEKSVTPAAGGIDPIKVKGVEYTSLLALQPWPKNRTSKSPPFSLTFAIHLETPHRQ